MANPNATPLYEGMFLFNPSAIDSSVATATETMEEILSRAEADVEALYKWDERKMAYPIEGQKRGLYMLAYFRVRGVQIANIERDVNLSDQVMRCLITRADHIGDVELDLARQKQAESRDAGAVEEAGESSEASEAPEAAAAPDTAETAEASRSESPASPSPDADSARSTPSEGGDETDAPESGTRATEEAEKS